MQILNKDYEVLAAFPNNITVPDCNVVTSNKLGTGHGEGKMYIANKDELYRFFGSENFNATCFLLKSDLINYLTAVKNEYFYPSQPYHASDNLQSLWKERMDYVSSLDDMIFFNVDSQNQIVGPRGYVNSEDMGYQIIRQISLPLVTYISIIKLRSPTGTVLFYWRIFVDFDAISEKKNGPLVFNYGKQVTDKTQPQIILPETMRETIRQARIGQGKYRDALLQSCPFCPITKISDERLLIASHIKPWAASNDKEKIDPKNGFILSPLFDKLFDRGFITFTPDRHMILSEYISPDNWNRMGLKNNTFIQSLPLDEERLVYLEFHQKSVFHGNI